MIKLHGIAISNYTDMVASALLEKGLPFESVTAMPSQDAAYLSKSPMGKIPCLETDRGFLTETRAILDYLEESHPTPALLPTDPFDRAKVRELTQCLELYVELVTRRGYGVLFGRGVPDDVKDGIKRDLAKGVAAVTRLARFSPWIAGNEFTYADLVGYWTFALANISASKNADIDLLAAIPGAQAWFERVGARDSVKKVLVEQIAARKAMGLAA